MIRPWKMVTAASCKGGPATGKTQRARRLRGEANRRDRHKRRTTKYTKHTKKDNENELRGYPKSRRVWSSATKTHHKMPEIGGSSLHSTTPYGSLPDFPDSL